MVDESESSTELDGSNQSPSLPGCVVYVSGGAPSDAGKHITLRKGTAIVGKAPSCRLQLEDKLLSRQHLELRVTNAGIVATDLGSTNGTYIDNQRIERAVLQPGARLRIGRSLLALLPLSRGDGLPLYSGDRYDELLGASASMRRLFALLTRIEPSEAPALLQGETGTGKELVARAIHRNSVRRDGPFVVLDCSTLSPDLASDALFGHARGAFTGAEDEHAGVFELADHGTVFMDEIGELSLELQARLLRVLESGELKRLGENTVRTVNVRVVAATHRDLARAVQQKTFREDLYYRLAVLEIEVPPLRERKEDIPMLAARFAKDYDKDSAALPASVLDRMSSHTWPGNVRELRNAVTRLLALGSSPFDQSPFDQEPGPDSPSASGHIDVRQRYRDERRRVLDDFERTYLEALMTAHDGNLSSASRASRLERHLLRALLRKHGLYERIK